MRKKIVGKVINSRMKDTIVVIGESFRKHPLYKKYVRSKTKYYVHDKKELTKAGDKVMIEETKPISKLKRWRIIKIIESKTND